MSERVQAHRKKHGGIKNPLLSQLASVDSELAHDISTRPMNPAFGHNLGQIQVMSSEPIQSVSAMVIQRADNKPEENHPLAEAGGIADFLKIVGEVPGLGGIKAVGQGLSLGSKVDEGINSDDNPLPWMGAAAEVGEWVGLPGFLGSMVDATSGVKDGMEGKTIGWFDAAQKFGMGTAELGEFELATAGELGAAEALTGSATTGLGTMGALGPWAALAGAGVAGWKTGEWFGKNTSAGKTAEDTFGVMDECLGAMGQFLGMKKEGDNKSTLTEMTEWAEENPWKAAATAPLAIPALVAGGAVAGGAGLVSGVADLGNRAAGGIATLGGAAVDTVSGWFSDDVSLFPKK